jgi:hypothetical protein
VIETLILVGLPMYSFLSLSLGQCFPSLTTGGNLWCVPMQRHANIKELLSLQKFPKKFKQVVIIR